MRKLSIALIASGGLLACLASAEEEEKKPLPFGPPQNMGQGPIELLDVHGAGAQRSDPKSGDPAAFPQGHGPQGDVVRIYHAARCVRDQSSGTFALRDTNQTSCYDTAGGVVACLSDGSLLSGQDGSYAPANPAYVDHGDGTVSDPQTGLMWQKSIGRVAFADRASYAAADRTGGHSDWRIPTIKELYSLMDFSGRTGSATPGSSAAPDDARPYLDTTVFDFEYPTTGRYIDAQYISNTEYVNTVMQGQKAFFGVNFADGRIKGYPQEGKPGDSQWYVRLVRSNPDYGKNSLVDQADGTILDTATGLRWMSSDSPALDPSAGQNGFLEWSGALAFCENLDHAGFTDWRLPDAKELHSIVDYTRSPDTTGSAALDPLFESTAIQNERGESDYPSYWSSTTHLDGKNPGEYAVYVTFGRALGYMRRPLPR